MPIYYYCANSKWYEKTFSTEYSILTVFGSICKCGVESLGVMAHITQSIAMNATISNRNYKLMCSLCLEPSTLVLEFVIYQRALCRSVCSYRRRLAVHFTVAALFSSDHLLTTNDLQVSSPASFTLTHGILAHWLVLIAHEDIKL